MGHVSGGSADAVRMKYIPTGVSSPGVPAAISSQVPEVIRPLAGCHRAAPPQATTLVHRAGLQPAHTGRRCRLLTAAVRSGRMAPPAVLCADTPQSSRGQRSSRPGPRRPLAQAPSPGDGGRCGRVPARPDGTTPPIGCVSRAPHVRSTPPSDPTSRVTPWRCPGPSAPRTPGQGTCTPTHDRMHGTHAKHEPRASARRLHALVRPRATLKTVDQPAPLTRLVLSLVGYAASFDGVCFIYARISALTHSISAR